MRQKTRVRKRGVVWPEKRRFEDELAAYLRDDARAEIAFKRLMRERMSVGKPHELPCMRIL